jgi:arsenate reductase
VREKPRILFLCTHNAARSQLAEALLRHHAGDRFEACSAGARPTHVHAATLQALVEVGVETAGLRSKGIHEFLGKVRVACAIVVCEPAEAMCPRLYPFATRTLHWPCEDPAREGETVPEQRARFRRVRGQIDTRIRTWLREAAADLTP